VIPFNHSYHISITVGRDRVLGIAARYGLDGVGIKLPVPVAERSKAVRLLVCLCCVLYSRDKRRAAMTIKTETRADTVRRENMRIKKNLGGSEIFCIRPERPWGPPSLLCKGYRVSFLGVKWPRRGVNHPPHLALKLQKEYSYTSTPALGRHGLF
jgi:hypothetical protein